MIQWSTGRVGIYTLRAVLDDTGLELVGLYVHSNDKIGIDAGELCGRPETGVVATNDIEELIALGADCVIYTAREPDTCTVERLLSSGLNVVCTTTFGSMALDENYRNALQDACTKGRSSLYFTGINPGWISTIAAALTAPCRRVDKVTVSESCNVGTDPNVEFWLGHGFSRPLGTPGISEFTRAAMLPFADTVARVATALDVELNSIEYRTDHATSRASVDLGWIKIEAGTIGALRTVWTGMKNGRALIETRITWRLSEDLDCDWTMSDGAYLVEIDGEPNSKTTVEWDYPSQWSGNDFAILTAQPAVGSIHAVCKAAPGILSLRDVGLPTAPVGRWR